MEAPENSYLEVRCGQCGLHWAALRFPMPMAEAGQKMRDMRCPVCGSDALFVDYRQLPLDFEATGLYTA